MRKGNALLRSTLVVCGIPSRNKNSYFYAQFMRISSLKSVAHSMLIAIYHILKDGVVFKRSGC